jgi:hypothetical protein
VAAAASSSECAIPIWWCEDETNSLDIPIGIGRGVGKQGRFVVLSMIMGVGDCVAFEEGEMMAIAVAIRCVMTHLMMCAQWD